MTTEQPRSTGILSFVNLGSYQRRARLAPAVLSLMPVLVATEYFELPLWLSDSLRAQFVLVGAWAALVIGLSHLASAAGNLAQRGIWRRWPYDSHLNTLLHPTRSPRSRQQRELWYQAIEGLTGVGVLAALGDDRETERVIEDGLASARIVLRSSNSCLLHEHNAEYGFARNVLGLIPIPLVTTAAALCCSWVWWRQGTGGLVGPLAWTGAWVVLVAVGGLVLPGYVRRASERYSESMLGALAEAWEASARNQARVSIEAAPSSQRRA